MKICYVTARNYMIATDAQEYDRVLSSLGIHRRMIYRLEMDEVPLQLRREQRFTGVYAPLNNKPFFYSVPKFIAGVMKAIGDERFDVVHVNSFRGCSLLPVLGRKISRNWIIEIRSSNVVAHGMKARLADRLTAFESRMFARTLIHSQALGKYMLGDREFVVTPTGANFAKLQQGQRESTRRQLNLSEDDIVIIYTGTLKRERNPFQILATFARVASIHPRTKLLVVGDSNLLLDLKRWSESQHLSDRITFTGSVPYDTIQDYLAAADIGFAYVPVTPNFDFNPPLKTVEFLAAGLPTVATDTVGNRMYIRHEQNGLIATDEVASLADALLRIITEPELAEHFRSCARQSAKDFDWHTIVAERLLPVYREFFSN